MPGRSATNRLIRNLASTTAFQASGYILAMLNVPYLTRTLGVADYGVLAFVISINAYLFLIIDWGFSLGATRDIAQAHGDEDVIRGIFWRTMTAKSLLSLAALIILFGVAELNRVPHPIYLVLPGVMNIVAAVLSVDWLVQGLERMGLFTLYSIGGRIVVVGLTFLLVHNPGDTWIACALQGFGSLAGSGAGFLIACRLLKMGKPRIHFGEAFQQIWDYRHYFLSQSSWIAYSTAAPLFLTFAAGSTSVGLFAGAERIARIVMALIVPVSIVMYPRVNALISRSRDAAANVAGPFLALQIIFASAVTLVLFFGAVPIVTIILGAHFGKAAEVLRWLSVLPLLTGVTGTLSRQFLIPLGWSREVSRITVVCTLIYLALLAVLCRWMGAPGAAIALISTETLITVVFVVFLFRRERAFSTTATLAVINAPRGLMTLFEGWVGKLRSS
ncbi:oligosaccharide flippase family protein [Acidisoma cladoniae]|jgi:PST family polysaccharide transporter|uniref:oligosaccharide flippase family protein n=1 Tax=Acidisoma cladoniae TaxID=3040935 RepID=UPI0025506195|nr:oligosaccharide flippase family protein [Acidisoma sp. PAMC 29798]